MATCCRAGSAQTGQAHDRAGGATLERMQTAELHNLLRCHNTRRVLAPELERAPAAGAADQDHDRPLRRGTCDRRVLRRRLLPSARARCNLVVSTESQLRLFKTAEPFFYYR